MAKTLHDRLVAALLGRGHILDPNPRSLKYTRLRHAEQRGDRPRYFFVGRAGALRVGYTTTLSHPAAERFKQALLSEQP